jgi:hypothetical protein
VKGVKLRMGLKLSIFLFTEEGNVLLKRCMCENCINGFVRRNKYPRREVKIWLVHIK